MGQKSEPSPSDHVYVFGLDRSGRPRGARFTVLKDSIVSAAMDMGYFVLIKQPLAVTEIAMSLPLGTVHGRGKVVKLSIPLISQRLYSSVLDAAQNAAQADCPAAAIPHTLH
jgi:hypothetical protein